MSIEELFRAAAGGDEAAVSALRRDMREEVDTRAMALSQSPLRAERVAGLTVLAQWRLAPDHHVRERVSVGLRSLRDSEPGVVRAAAWVLSYMNLFSDEAQEALRALSGHEDSDVRAAVAAGLGMRIGEPELETMLRLMSDSDSSVRNWATFGIASDATLDSSAVRDCLRGPLSDGFEDARLEALWDWHYEKTGRA